MIKTKYVKVKVLKKQEKKKAHTHKKMELAQNQPFEGLVVDGVSFVSSIEHLEIVSEVFVSLSSK